MSRGAVPWWVWVTVGVGGLMVVTAAASAGVSEMFNWPKDVILKVYRRVSQHEGGYDAVNPNTDGAGVSVGRLQWPQRVGTLGTLVREWARRDPVDVVTALGPNASDVILVLVADTEEGRMQPVNGAALWQEPWVSRWKAAGHMPTWQAVQDEFALEGTHMADAIAIRDVLGLRTERGLAVAFDRSVQQGPRALTLARSLVDRTPDWRSLPESERLGRYIFACAAPFERRSPPVTNPSRWREVASGVWHYFAGKVDLAKDIRRRGLALLDDTSLSDVPVLARAPNGRFAGGAS